MAISNQTVTVLTTGADTFTGVSDTIIVHGDRGDDTITGSSSNDTIIGGSGDDQLSGGPGGADLLYGGDGNDILFFDVAPGATGPQDRLYGDAGSDRLVIRITSSDFSVAVQQEINFVATQLALGRDPGNGGEYEFSTLPLKIHGFESLVLMVDGVITNPAERPRGAATPDQFQVGENAAILTGDVSLNDGVGAGDQFFLVSADETAASFTLRTDGTFDFQPNGQFDFLGAGETLNFTFVYRLQTDTTNNQATATITIVGANDAPSAGGISFTGTEDAASAGNLRTLAEASDPDANDVLSVSAVAGQSVGASPTAITLASGAIITVSANGTFSYDPNGAFDFLAPGQSDTDVFTVTISDGKGGSVQTTATATITGLNDAPTAVDDAFTVDQDSTGGLPVLANDFDVDGTSQGYPILIDFTDSDNGGAVSFGDAGLIFDTAGDFVDLAAGETRQTTFSYTIQDEFGASDSGVVTVTVTGANDAPSASGVIASVSEDAPFVNNLIAFSDASDPDTSDTLSILSVNGQTLTAGSITLTTSGGASLTVSSNGDFTYDPTVAFNALSGQAQGSDDFTFVITDGNGGTVGSFGSLTILGVNDAPVAVNDAFATNAQTEIDIDPLANDSDVDSAFSLDSFDAAGSQGGALSEVEGVLSFSPGEDFLDLAPGATRNTSFTYTILDQFGATATATITVTVTGVGAGPNTPPTGGAATLEVNEDETGAGNLFALSGASDPDAGDAIRIVSVDGQALGGGDLAVQLEGGGRVAFSSNGDFVFDPLGQLDFLAEGQQNDVPLQVVISDLSGATATITTTVSIFGVNDAPVLSDDTATVDEGSSAEIDVLANDFDFEEVLDASNISGFNTTGTAGGAFSLGSTGIVFDAAGDFDDLAAGQSRETSIAYEVTDSNGATTTATLVVTVTGVNDAPGAAPDAATTNQNAAIEIDVLANDSDPEDGTPSIDFFDSTGSAGGTISFGPTGLIFDPSGDFDDLAAGETRVTTFEYGVIDAAGETAQTTVTVTVTGLNDAPAARDDTFGLAVDLDLVVAVTNSQGIVSVFNNDGTGSFSGGDATLGGSSAPTDVALGDLDGDGDLDAFVTFESGQADRVLLNDGTGVFTDSGQLLGNFRSVSVELADFDGDGDLDAFVGGARTGGGTANQVLLNNGAGVFTNTGQGIISGIVHDVEIADLNNDEIPDIVLADNSTLTSDLFFGNGDGSFTVAGVSLVAARGAALGDVDGDGDIDIALATTDTAGGRLYINDGQGNFADTGAPFGAYGSFDVDLGDVDGDGDLDAVVAGVGNSAATVFLNDGAGAFAEFAQSLPIVQADDIDLADLDGDGDLDFVAFTEGSGVTRTFINDGTGRFTQAQDLSISSVGNFTFSTGHGKIGDVDGDGGQIFADTATTLKPLSNDFDVDGDALRITSIGSSALGAGVAIAPDGKSLQYDPTTITGANTLPVGQTVTDTITYTISDGAGGTSTATISVIVTGVSAGGLAPIARDESSTVNEESRVDVAVLNNDSAPDGGPLTTSIVAGQTFTGAVSVLANQSIRFDPAGAFDFLSVGDTATETIRYLATDSSNGLSDEAVFTVTITGVNDAPTGGSITATITENQTRTGNLIAESGATDRDQNDVLKVLSVTIGGQTFTVTGTQAFTTAGGATITLSEDGTYTYDPTVGFDALTTGQTGGPDRFTVTLDDQSGGSLSSATVSFSLSVTGVNDAPQVTPIQVDVRESDNPFSIDLLEFASDPEGANLQILGFNQISGSNVFAGSGVAGARIEGPTDYSYAGGGVGVGDVNGDGIGDAAVFASYNYGSSKAVFLVFGASDFPATVDAADGATDSIVNVANATPPDGFLIIGASGGSTAFNAGDLGDLNGDGFDEILIADYYGGPNGGGLAYVLFGGKDALAALGGSADLGALPASAGFTLSLGAGTLGDRFGEALSTSRLGDVDKDGAADLLIGSERVTRDDAIAHFVSGGALAGAVGRTGVVNVEAMAQAADGSAYRFIGGAGAQADDFSLRSVSLDAGDIDGDGVQDFLLGAARSAYYSAPGETYIIFGGGDGLAALDARSGVDGNLNLEDVEAVGGFVLVGAGGQVTTVGDVNGDGADDFMVARYDLSVYDLFGAYLVFGGRDNLARSDSADGVADGRIDLSQVASSGGGLHFRGFPTGEGGLEIDFARLGDIDGDGFEDFAIAEGGHRANYDYYGQLRIVLSSELADADAFDGSVDGDVPMDFLYTIRSTPSQTTSDLGRTFADRIGSADLNGDGMLDLLIEERRFFDGVRFASGAVHTVFGGGTNRLTELDDDADRLIQIGDALGVQTSTGNPPAGALVFDGTVGFNPSAFGFLNEGETETLVFEFLVSDGASQTTNTLTITVTGESVAVSPAAPVSGLGLDDGSAATSASTETSSGSGALESLPPPAPSISADAVEFGGSGNDVIIGDGSADTIRGGGGRDFLNGRAGPDLIFGDSGDDEIRGGRGTDTLNGGRGDDLILGQARDDILRGGFGRDTLNGGGDDDLLLGQQAGDTLIGGFGRDTLNGGGNDDRLAAGGGADTLVGGAGDDTLIGGGFRDKFIFADNFGDDRILDFETDLDTLAFRQNSSVSGMADLTFTDVARGVLIEDGAGSSVLLVGVAAADLDRDNFIF